MMFIPVAFVSPKLSLAKGRKCEKQTSHFPTLEVGQIATYNIRRAHGSQDLMRIAAPVLCGQQMVN